MPVRDLTLPGNWVGGLPLREAVAQDVDDAVVPGHELAHLPLKVWMGLGGFLA
ncbi:MAG: hypothetical protein HN869_08570, partial [Verrucomicrobia bacterium]|nr:hypothetical protein [Verrucomicrobiota bacterium]